MKGKIFWQKQNFQKNYFLWSEFGAFVIVYFKNLGPNAGKPIIL